MRMWRRLAIVAYNYENTVLNYQKNEENKKHISEKEIWCNCWLGMHHSRKIKISQNNSQ